MRDKIYQSGMDRSDEPRGHMLTVENLDTFGYLVREDLRLCCTRLSDAERDGGDLEEEGFLERLALFARLALAVDRRATTFALSSDEIPHFQHFMRDVLFTESDEQAADDGSDVLLAVASAERVELIDALATQVGLF